MAAVPSPYHQLVLEHSRTPRRFGELAERTHAADGANPLCGDALHVELRVVDKRIVGYAFRGEACAITRASASMLGERLDNAGVNELAGIEAALHAVIERGVADDASLGELNALAALEHYPSRRKCALLPLAVVGAALSGEGVVSTEENKIEEASQ